MDGNWHLEDFQNPSPVIRHFAKYELQHLTLSLQSRISESFPPVILRTKRSSAPWSLVFLCFFFLLPRDGEMGRSLVAAGDDRISILEHASFGLSGHSMNRGRPMFRWVNQLLDSTPFSFSIATSSGRVQFLAWRGHTTCADTATPFRRGRRSYGAGAKSAGKGLLLSAVISPSSRRGRATEEPVARDWQRDTDRSGPMKRVRLHPAGGTAGGPSSPASSVTITHVGDGASALQIAGPAGVNTQTVRDGFRAVRPWVHLYQARRRNQDSTACCDLQTGAATLNHRLAVVSVALET